MYIITATIAIVLLVSSFVCANRSAKVKNAGLDLILSFLFILLFTASGIMGVATLIALR